MERTAEDLVVTDCDHCHEQMNEGYMVPTGRTVDEMPLVEIICKECNHKRRNGG